MAGTIRTGLHSVCELNHILAHIFRCGPNTRPGVAAADSGELALQKRREARPARTLLAPKRKHLARISKTWMGVLRVAMTLIARPCPAAADHYERRGQDSRYVFSRNNIHRHADRYRRAGCGVIALGWRRALRQRAYLPYPLCGRQAYGPRMPQPGAVICSAAPT